MKKTFTLTLILICISFASRAQRQKLDSLYNVLAHHAKDDTVKVKLILSICRLEYYANLDTLPQLAAQALAISKKINFINGTGFSYTYFAVYHRARGEWSKVADYALKMVSVFEGSTNDDGLAQAYNWLGIAHQELENYEKALFYQEKSLAIHTRSGQRFDMGRNYNNMGIIFSELGRHDEAIDSFLKALAINEEFKDDEGICNAYINLGETYINKKDYPSAIRYYDKALPSAQKRSDKVGQAAIHIGLADIYTETRQYDQALMHAQNSLVFARELEDKARIMDAYGKLSAIENFRGNFKSALQHLQLHYQYKDSAYNETRVQQFNELEKKYETEKKEQTISLLEKDNEIKSLSRNLLMAGLTSVLLIGALVFYFQRQRNRRNQILLKKQEELNEKLLEADHLKSRFFANISHEFRTPLTLILSPIEEKLEADNLPQKDKISFQSIRRSANRLLELINQLLEQSKLESGFMKLHLQPGKLYPFIMPILSSFDSLADVNQVQFCKEIRIPEYTVLFDCDKLEKILNNLLSNAFKFSPRSGKVEIEVNATGKGTRVELTIEVKNSGTVIPTAQLNKIFDPFFQGENASHHAMQGTGLGLSLVKELVKLYGGEIQVRSTADEGTIFGVSIPLEKSNLQETLHPDGLPSKTRAFELEADHVSSETDASKQTVLVVEDNQEVRTLIRKGLEAHYNIVEASTGKEGLQLANERQADLVISDVMMPVMNGVELCHHLKNDEVTSHIPVVLLTARADHESKLEGLRTGADDYLIKPFNMQELLARINNLIDQRTKLIRKYHQQIVVQPHEITVTPLDERFIQRAIQFIENNLDDAALGVDKMSHEVGMSRTNLHRKLKSITGMATSEFIQDFRLRRAALLIEKKADSISQIAYQVGFNDQSYFTKCFKKKFGKTPSEFAAVTTSS